MSKITYLAKRIAHMDYKNMILIASDIGKKTKKSKWSILIDMIRCGTKYQAGYYDYLEFEFYLLNEKQRSTYLTRGINNEIVRRFNEPSKRVLFDDKYGFYQLFEPFLHRSFFSLKDHNDEELKEYLKDKLEVIVKPVKGEGGIGVGKLSITEDMDMEALYHQLIAKDQSLMEEVVQQHSEMSELYPNSVNTLRIFTFYDQGTTTVLQTVLKLGNGGVVDNFSSGGMYTFLDEFGKIKAPAIDKEDNIFYLHPITHKELVGFQVPYYEEAKALVKEAAKVIPEVQYVGWDVAISPDGPVLIEGNSFPGVFQLKPSLTKDKIGMLPTYDKVMHLFVNKK